YILAPSTAGVILTMSGVNLLPSIELLKRTTHWVKGEQSLLLGQPQYESVIFIGPYVRKVEDWSAVVVSGPSAEGVPFGTVTLIIESARNAFSVLPSGLTARNASQRPSWPCERSY